MPLPRRRPPSKNSTKAPVPNTDPEKKRDTSQGKHACDVPLNDSGVVIHGQ